MIESTNIFDIPIVFRNKFPNNYKNDIMGWGLDKKSLHSKNHDGTYKLLSLDIDFGSDCSLSCPHCFRKNFNDIKSDFNNISLKELKVIINDAINIGLKYVKIIGAGEPFENSEILQLIEFLSKNGIVTSIFTKGHVIGNDLLVKEKFGHYNLGINDSISLLNYLKDHDVSLMLGFNSFNEELQGEFVGLKNSKAQYEYFNYRNRALINAINCGFNDYIPGKKTRLALIAAPIKPENIEEIFEIFKFGRVRNIYVVSCPTTVSGLGKKEYKRETELMDMNIYIDLLKKLYIDIYSWSIEKNLISINEIFENGISLYPGCHPCNQVAGGFYLTNAGKAFSCPGRDDTNYLVSKDVRQKKLKDIWLESYNYKLASETDKFNFYCTARDYHFFKKPVSFYRKIELELLNKFKVIPNNHQANIKKHVCNY